LHFVTYDILPIPGLIFSGAGFTDATILSVVAGEYPWDPSYMTVDQIPDPVPVGGEQIIIDYQEVNLSGSGTTSVPPTNHFVYHNGSNDNLGFIENMVVNSDGYNNVPIVFLWVAGADLDNNICGVLDTQEHYTAPSYGTTGNYSSVNTQSGQIAIGSTAVRNFNGVVIGKDAADKLDGGQMMTIIGENAAPNITYGTSAVAIGHNVLLNATTAQYSVAVGHSAGAGGANSYTTIIGHGAGMTSQMGSGHVAIGAGTAGTIAGVFGVSIGADTNASGNNSIAIGRYACTFPIASNAITFGSNAISRASGVINIGQDSGRYFRSGVNGSNSISIGANAGPNNAGSGSIHIGQQAGRSTQIGWSINGPYSGANSVAIGTQATAGGTDSIAIGKGATVLNDNTIVLSAGVGVGGGENNAFYAKPVRDVTGLSGFVELVYNPTTGEIGYKTA
jgi:hypothetical protein